MSVQGLAVFFLKGRRLWLCAASCQDVIFGKMPGGAHENRVFPCVGAGAGKCGRISRACSGRDGGFSAHPLTFCRRAGAVWRTGRGGVSAERGRMPSTCHCRLCGGAVRSRRKRAAGGRRFSPFLTETGRNAACLPRLCGKKFVPFSKDGNFFQQRNRDFGGEMHDTGISRGRFLTIGAVVRTFWEKPRSGKRRISFLFARESGASGVFWVAGGKGSKKPEGAYIHGFMRQKYVLWAFSSVCVRPLRPYGPAPLSVKQFIYLDSAAYRLMTFLPSTM